MKIAIIGAHPQETKALYDNLSQRFSIIELAACSDPDMSAAEHMAEQYGIPALPIDEILQDPEIRIILNATFAGDTEQITERCLKAKKNVFTSKQIANSFEKGKQLYELAEENGVEISCGPDCFMNGGMQTARWMIDHKIAGNIRSGSVMLNRNSRLFGEFVTYLYEKDGSILHDVGCYYILPLLEMLGPVTQVSAFGMKTEEEHEMKRLGGPMYGEIRKVPDNNIFTANLRFANDVLVTINFNGATAILQSYDFALYGDKGIIGMGHPHDYDIPVTLQTAQSGPIEVPFTHGFTKGVHFGVAAAEMAWSMVKGREPRQSADTALHLLEVTKALWYDQPEDRTQVSR